MSEPRTRDQSAEYEGAGAELIAAERQRQIDAEGWTPEHDDEHSRFEMTDAAEAYLWVVHGALDRSAPSWWPWDVSWWKPSDDPIRNLVKAGALIAAEIDRLQRVHIVSDGGVR